MGFYLNKIIEYFIMIKVNSIFKGDLFLNKVAIVTGGATGIGACIAHELAHLGCNVVIASRKKENVDKVSALMNKNDSIKGKVLALPCNIRKREDVDSLIKETVNKFGKLDFLINNGGGQFMCPADSISPKGWHAVVETNLTGTFNCCQSAYNQHMKENGGVIVNIIADMWNGFPNMAHTGAARAGVDNLTKTLALEWIQNGVRINSVAPGTVYSDTAAKNYPHDVFGEALKLQPCGRLGTTEEVSSAVCFLLSPAASFITGETLKVDGAQSLYRRGIEIQPHNKIPSYKWSSKL